jgi:hypothetical protein
MAADSSKRSARPSCTCQAPGSKYCSTECAAMEKTPDVACRCGHAGRGGKTHQTKQQVNREVYG